jgi:hypothetical protein
MDKINGDSIPRMMKFAGMIEVWMNKWIPGDCSW